MKRTHQPSSRHFRGPAARVRIQITPSGSTAATATAFTPPHVATTSALSAAARRTDPRSLAVTSGSSTHGARAIGQTSTDTPPSSVVIRGVSTYAKPASTCVVGDPRSRRWASRTIPTNARQSSRLHQARWITQGGRFTSSPTQKNGPIGQT